jgi:hypothetical protein
MQIELDSDLQELVCFMQSNFETSKLASLAEAINRLSPLLWGSYRHEPIVPMAIGLARSECKPETSTQSVSMCSDVADDFGEVVDRLCSRQSHHGN